MNRLQQDEESEDMNEIGGIDAQVDMKLEKESADSVIIDDDSDTLKLATVALPSQKTSQSSNVGTILNKMPLGGTEVKCDQCTKVFYNLDFLAIHKHNKHDKSRSSISTMNNNNNNNKENNNSSMNMGGIRSKSGTNLNKQGGGNQGESSNILHTESFCEYCNKSFCNKYFLRTHMSKAHGKTLIIENNSNNTIINNLLNGEQNNADSAGSQTGGYSEDDLNINLNETYFASKVVDRVQCDICNKQVCNKYFLRTHKQKVCL